MRSRAFVQLASCGVEPVEATTLEDAERRLREAVSRLMAGEETAEKEVDSMDRAIRLHPDYAKREAAKAEARACTHSRARSRSLALALALSRSLSLSLSLSLWVTCALGEP